MRTVVTILLLLAVAALGSGAMSYLHDLDHARADAAEDARLAADANVSTAPTASTALTASPASTALTASTASTALAASTAAGRVPAAPPAHHHDDSNCAVHAQLHAPLVSAGAVPVLVAAGLMVAFVSELPRSLPVLRLPARIDCRGPPVVA